MIAKAFSLGACRTAACAISFFLVLSLAAPLGAQSFWIVDQQARPGSHFTDLPPAVAAAAPGDVVLVRFAQPVAYTAPTVDRPLVILGEEVQGGLPSIRGIIQVTGIPANGRVVIAGFNLQSQLVLRQDDVLIATSVAGRLAIANCRAQGIGIFGMRATFTDCADVTLTGCQWNLTGGGTVAIRSRLLVQESTLEGSQFRDYSGFQFDAAPGLDLRQSEATLVRSTLLGSGGLHTTCGWSCHTSGTPSRAAAAIDAGSRLFAGPGSALVATRSGSWSFPYGSSSYNHATEGPGLLIRDAGCLVLGAVVAAQERRLPQTFATLGRVGGAASVGVDDTPGSLVVLAASYRPTAPVTTAFGSVLLDAASTVVLGLGATDANGRFELPLPITIHLPLGSELVGQGLLLSATSGILLATPAIIPVLPPRQ